MTNSNPSSHPISKKFNWLIFAIIVLALIGFTDASFLAAKSYLGGPIPCVIFTGCDTVTQSVYSKIWNIPISLPGALYYAVIFFLGILYFDLKRDWIIRLIVPLTFIGFAISLYLVYLQIFVIEALCLYCLISAADSTLLFTLSLFALRGLENKELKNGQQS